MTTRAELVDHVRAMIGTPYHHAARSPGVGLDCAGPAVCSFQHFGLPWYDQPGYPKNPDPDDPELHYRLCSEIYDQLPGPDFLQPGDLLLFAMDDERRMPRHYGIVTPPHPDGDGLTLQFVHCFNVRRYDAGACEERPLSRAWLNRIFACFHVPGVI